MSLRDLDLKYEYRNKLTNITDEFLIPVLSEAVLYKRAVGFFSSSSLIEISEGIAGLVNNGGHIQLITSPQLYKEDIDAISNGYAEREVLLQQRMLEQLPPINELSNMEKDRFNLLAWLISRNMLDIRIAFTESADGIGIYHEKVGIVEDAYGNKLAFSGSMNESATALNDNYEVIDVYFSWDDEQGRVETKEARFNAIWDNNEVGVSSYDFPEVKERIVANYLTHEPDFSAYTKHSSEKGGPSVELPIPGIPMVPSYITLREYQKEAISNWEAAGYRGIFDMATGSGKTITALAAITYLSQKLGNHLTVIIVCPYQHLVEQWVGEVKSFNIDPIVGYSSSSQKDWYRSLDDAIRNQKYNVRGSDFICFICTNGTFATEKVQKIVGKINSPKLLVIDEAHNFGAEYLRTLLRDDFEYRLALSATIIRHGDKTGTDALFDYFGDRCIEYTLEEAINGRGDEPPCLTPYRYYPIVVYLEDDELKIYDNLSMQIAQCIVKSKNGKRRLSEKGKRLALKRARLVAAAHQKLPALKEYMQKYRNDYYILVYCGATQVTIDSTEIDCSDISDEELELRQIDAVTQILGGDLGMKVRQFTSRESSKEREEIKAMFINKRLQALIAIKCLDEGVDIPMIKTAFILASTTNPREYIQRRGRLLRKDKNGEKEIAEIYDFITLPRNEDMASIMPENDIKGEKTLVYNELSRAKEFAELAQNHASIVQKLDKIEESYFGNDGFAKFRIEEAE